MLTMDDDFDIELKLLFEAVYFKYSYDFRDYSQATLKRRVAHALVQFKLATVSELQERVLQNSDSFTVLLRYLTIPTSEMFRDPSYFLSVRSKVAPILRTYPALKIWIAGCSTGEEVYSMAILLHEEGLLERTILYATDINPESLEKAAAGIFSAERVKEFTYNYQKSGGKNSFSDYYSAAYGLAVFDKKLKKNITFADHSLATDSVFSETHFISCRNVLIYFNRNLQNRAIGLFHESLCHNGFLGLGSKETVQYSNHKDFLSAFLIEDQIFQKKESKLEFN